MFKKMKTKRNHAANGIDSPTHSSGERQPRAICAGAFCGCRNLAAIKLPDGIEEIGIDAFREAWLESITTPLSVKIIRQGAFSKCPNLKHVVLNKGLETLGTAEYFDDGRTHFGVFENSSVERV